MDKPIITYHVFTDGFDEYYDNRQEAEEAYKTMCEDFTNVRLYKEIAVSAYDTEEIYLMGEGDSPL